VISRDRNSGIQSQFGGTIIRAKGLPTTKELCNANLEYGDEVLIFKYPEPDLEVLNDKVLGSVTIPIVQIHRAAI